MAFEIQTQKLDFSKSTSFTFQQEVKQYLFGISGFSLTYGEPKAHHHVQKFALDLSGGNSGNTVGVSVSKVELSDNSKNTIDLGQSWVYATVIAWTGGTTNSELYLSQSLGMVQSGSTSTQAATLPSAQPLFLQAAMVGFDLEFASGDHKLESVNAQVSAQNSGNQGYFKATASMSSGSVSASQPAADGALMATSVDPTTLGFVIPTGGTGTVSHQSQFAVKFPMTANVSSAVALLTSFTAQFPPWSKTHDIMTIGAGPTTVTADGSNQVSVTGLQAIMCDQEGNSQDNDSSSATILLIGLP